MFNVKNQKKGRIKRKLNLITKRKPILIADSPKLRIKINRRKPAITILDSKVKINVITRKTANRFGLTIKQQSKVLMIVYDKNALAFFKICKNMEIAMGKMKVLQYLYVFKGGTYNLLLSQLFAFVMGLKFKYIANC